MSMFCFQCEQTSNGAGCTVKGVCGKDETTAALQDLLTDVARKLSQAVVLSEQAGVTRPAQADDLLLDALFTTVTNVNFDPARLDQVIDATYQGLQDVLSAAAQAGVSLPASLTGYTVAPAGEPRLKQAAGVGIEARMAELGEDLAALSELVLYGLKGAAAYLHHAERLGAVDSALGKRFHELTAAASDPQATVDSLVGASMETGKLNLDVMALLDGANTGTYGHPEPTQVRLEPRKGKAILVSGHDLRDLHDLLVQTEGKGINIYTHGEMLPAHAYPELKKFTHLAGHYGGAWQLQAREFSQFPGAILMTTNCIQQPRPDYIDRIFTSGLVAFPGVQHIPGRDFTPVIEAALAAPGFAEDGGDKTITVGFGHNAVLSVAPVVIDAVKSGAIRHFFLVGGCDGAKAGRNYYTQLAQQIPDDCVILTLACGKFRFNRLEFGEIGGIPRLLDMGQCNDAYSAIRVAVALAEAFECGVNDLPLSLVLSWYEQKAVAILLTLLSLGIKDIRVGPSLPAFIPASVLNVLVEQFGLKPITTPEADLQAILGAA